MANARGGKVSWPFDSTGFVTTAQNVGVGAGQIFRDENPPGTLNFKTILAGAGIAVTNLADEVKIDCTVVPPTELETTVFLSPYQWIPNYTNQGAPRVWEYYNGGTGASFLAVKFPRDPGVAHFANSYCLTPHKMKMPYVNTDVVMYLHWINDNADVNNIAWEFSGGVLVPGANADIVINPHAQAVAPGGLDFYNRTLITSFAFDGTPDVDRILFLRVARGGGDSNVGNAYMLGMEIIFKEMLS